MEFELKIPIIIQLGYPVICTLVFLSFFWQKRGKHLVAFEFFMVPCWRSYNCVDWWLFCLCQQIVSTVLTTYVVCCLWQTSNHFLVNDFRVVGYLLEAHFDVIPEFLESATESNICSRKIEEEARKRKKWRENRYEIGEMSWDGAFELFASSTL